VRDSDASNVGGLATIYYTTGTAGQNNHGLDFGFTPQRYDLGNKVWFDTNNNGVVDGGEQPVGGVLMQLKDATGSVIGTTTTDAQGYYSFTNLLAGNYTVTVAASNFAAGGVLENYFNSDATTASSNAPGDNDKDHGVNPATAAAYLSDGVSSSTITLGPGLPTGEDGSGPATPNGDSDNNLTIDFGFYKLELGNRIWEDYNNNGVIDAGEPALANVTVELRDRNGAVISTTTTNAQGYYTFTRLMSGTYQVALPASNFATGGALEGLTSSTGANGQPTGPYEPGIGEGNTLTGDNGDHGAVVGVLGQSGGEVRSGLITMTPGAEPVVNNGTGTTQQPTIDFGLFKPAQVGNYVWYDRNHDGIQNNSAGETGVGGVTVTLLLNGTPISTTFTAADGSYTFTNLISGTGYAVRFEVPGTLTFTVGSTANPDGSATNSDVPGGGQTGTTDTFELGYGESEPDIDAGVYEPASIGDTVWFDVNGNGQQEPGENGVPGVTATLMISTLTGYIPYSTTVTTDGGYYEFPNLDPGTYYVSFTLPANQPYTWTLPLTGDTSSDSDVSPSTGTTPPVTLVSGERNPTIDGGITPYASLGNRVWEDVDHDGEQDVDEPGVSGVTVTLYKDGVPIASQLTGANGIYSFTNLISGTYTVTFGLPAGATWTVETPNSGQTGMTSPDTDSNVTNPVEGTTEPIVLNWGESNPTIDAGIWRPMALGNRVWFDTNNDGIDNDGSGGALGTGVNGATMQLYVDSNDDGVLTIGVDQLISTTTTDGNGYYTFTNLISDTYFVGMPATNFAAGGVLADYRNSDATVSGDSDQNERDHGVPQSGDVVASGPITLNYGQEPVNDGDADPYTNYSIDFGYYKLELGNRVWDDLDNDGVKDASEPGLPGVVVTLYDVGGTVVATTTTDANGVYAFTRLAPGDYIVGVTPPAGYSSSLGAEGEGDPNGNTDELGTVVSDNGVVVRPNGEIRANPITLTPGGEPSVDSTTGNTANPTVDFGVYQPASLGNYVWRDDDRDGIQNEPAENGINGVTVTLLLNGQVVLTTVTANEPSTGRPGYYTFTNLISGTYQVQFDLSGLPAGTRPTIADATDDAQDSDADPATGLTAPVAIYPGDANPDIDMGVILPAGLGDFVWLDVDKDGQQGEGEPAVPGVVVTLYSNGQVVSSTTTDANGLYRFVDLTPGVAYTLSFAAPGGYVWTTPGTTPTSGSDSNVDAGGNTGVVTLAPNLFNGTIDAGLWQPSVVALAKTNLNPGAVRTGQEIGYQIVVRNTGVTQAKGVIVKDAIPAGTTYVAGSASPAATETGGVLTWPVVELMPGAHYTVTFQVRVNASVGASVAITNVATVQTDDQTAVLSSNEVQNPLSATAVTLDRLEVAQDGANVKVRWQTALELNTLGYNVWWSATDARTDAVKVNAAVIAANGPNGGSYQVTDTAGRGANGRYWIEEIELGGAVNWYGPALVGTATRQPDASEGGVIRVDRVGAARLVDGPAVAAALAPAGDDGRQPIVAAGVSPVVVSGAVAPANVAGESAPALVAKTEREPVSSVLPAATVAVDVSNDNGTVVVSSPKPLTSADAGADKVAPAQASQRNEVNVQVVGPAATAKSTKAQPAGNAVGALLALTALGALYLGGLGVVALRRRKR
jgi:uncharacterized repeat protein (TIGR01451 family)